MGEGELFQKNMTDEEIKQYIIDTIRTGNKKRIDAVLKRWLEYRQTQDLVNKAKIIFKSESSK
jgi:hypothetical protein